MLNECIPTKYSYNPTFLIIWGSLWCNGKSAELWLQSKRVQILAVLLHSLLD